MVALKAVGGFVVGSVKSVVYLETNTASSCVGSDIGWDICVLKEWSVGV